MQSCINLPVIGYHRSPLSQKFGVPRQPNLTSVVSYIEMIAPYDTPDAFEGLEAFSHLWIMWQAHHNRVQAAFKPKVRPPRLGGNTKLGVFATRSTYRPSQLGLSVVQLIDIIKTDTGVALHIVGADMVDATPIIDIKPYVAYSDAIPHAVSGFAPTKPLSKEVRVKDAAQKSFETIILGNPDTAKSRVSKNSHINNCVSIRYSKYLNQQDLATICELIAQDPRPAYRQANTEQIFMMRYKEVDIGFCMDSDGVMWIESVMVVNH